MAFPTIVSVATTSLNTGATSHTVNLPGTFASGDKLFIVVSADGSPTITMSTSGWTKEVQVTATDSTCLFSKTSDGTEGSTVTVALTASEPITAIAVAVNGGTSFQNNLVSTGTSAFHRVPIINPTPIVMTECLALVFASTAGNLSYTTGEPYEISNTAAAGDGTTATAITQFHARECVLRDDIWFDGGIVPSASANGRGAVVLCYGLAVSGATGSSASAVNGFSRVQSF